MACPSINVNTVYRENEKSISGTKDWETCSKLCREREDCRFWTWYHKDDPTNALKCVTMTGKGGTSYSYFTATGDHKCGGRYYRFKV